MPWLDGAVRDILTHLTDSCQAHDYVGMTLNAPSFSQGPVWLSFRPAREYVPEDVWGLIRSVAQSAHEFRIEPGAECEMTTCVVRGVEGRGRKALTYEDITKRSILSIINADNLCLPRSLVTARVHAERGEIRSGEMERRWRSIRDGRRAHQRDAALELVRVAGVRVPARGCGLPEIRQFQEHFALEGFAIIVYEFLTFGRRAPPLFDGRERVIAVAGRVKYTLHILYYERSCHYQPITNLAGALGSRGFCEDCNAKYRDVLDHRCSKRCPRCKSINCNASLSTVKCCEDCNRVFFGDACFERHKQANSAGLSGRRRYASVCEALKICRVCSGAIKITAKKHVCGESFCYTCMTTRPVSHHCFIPPLKNTDNTQNNNANSVSFVFYDFETQQHAHLPGDESTRVHEPNLCVAQRVCLACLKNENIEMDCVACGKREFIFADQPVGQLVELVTRSPFSKTVCIAHNARGFDAQFILRYLVERKKSQLPTLIMNGTKIISMKIGDVVFLDSLNYLPMALSALPKAFGFADSVAKGTFPHFFNRPENQFYIGELPPLHFYSPDTMFAGERAKFLEWYTATKNAGYVFDFAAEFVRYCRTDVTVLRRACLAFRELLIQCGNVCPFTESCTIASSCSRIYRKNFLESDRIGIVPPSGYRWGDRQSRKAVAWLVWREREIGREIRHAAREREYRPPHGLPAVDGYYEVSENERYVLQFHGCFWHGCPRCYRVNRDRELKFGDTMDERYERTVAISKRIRSRGYRLTEIWECQFDRLVANNEEMAAYVQNHPMVARSPLEPRDAFYGGRTENFVNLYEISGTQQQQQQIRYVDVCSLYPWVCKTGKFPVGHPRLYVGEECKALLGVDNDLSAVEGLVKCVVLAPRDLYIPVLPIRMHGKLLFALCKACCVEMNNGDCSHENPCDREFEGTWVVDELRKAVSLGYRVVRVDEIWQYEITRYDPVTRRGGLFAEYIDTFLRIKQEASGVPANCLGDDDAIDRYVASYERAEGIKLDRAALCANPGLRSLAKLALNSFWGKFGQRENLTNTKVVSTRRELMDLLTSAEIKVTGILPVNHQVIYVNYTATGNAIRPTQTSNVVIAAYTTAQARLKLYEYLEGLGRRVLYCDTDSCIYVSRPDNSNDYEPPIGQFLGDLTDELETYGPGSYITSFVSGGPKFYAYVVRKADGTTCEVCKVKGITLNYANSRQVNYEMIRSFVTGTRTTPVVLKFDAIRRTMHHRVVTRRETKSCEPVNVKRRQAGEHRTLPYGFRE